MCTGPRRCQRSKRLVSGSLSQRIVCRFSRSVSQQVLVIYGAPHHGAPVHVVSRVSLHTAADQDPGEEEDQQTLGDRTTEGDADDGKETPPDEAGHSPADLPACNGPTGGPN